MIPAHSTTRSNPATVWASASQGDEITLDNALVSTWPVDLLIVSPLFRGSNPYPCGSLTYRVLLFYPHHMIFPSLCQPFFCKSNFRFMIFFLFQGKQKECDTSSCYKPSHLITGVLFSSGLSLSSPQFKRSGWESKSQRTGDIPSGSTHIR